MRFADVNNLKSELESECRKLCDTSEKGSLLDNIIAITNESCHLVDMDEIMRRILKQIDNNAIDTDVVMQSLRTMCDVAELESGKSHSRWILKRRMLDYVYVCESCERNSKTTSRFCPNCGARMDSTVNEDEC